MLARFQAVVEQDWVVRDIAAGRNANHHWTDRNWDFEGQLDGGTIRGKMFLRDQTGAVVKTADLVWSGKERRRLYSFDADKDWLVVTPDGLFDGSPGAWRFVSYRNAATETLVDDDATRRRGYRPGLLAKIYKKDL